MLARILKILSVVLIVLVIMLAGLFSYIKFMLPDVGEPEEIEIGLSKERIEKGAYLANHVAMCIVCHSQRD